jgi:tetratricopeptide (TPR) repeat protein
MRKTFLLSFLILIWASLNLSSFSWGQVKPKELETAETLINLGKYAEGIKLLEQLQVSYPSDIRIYNLLKRGYLQARFFPQLKNLINQQIEKSPKNPEFYFDLADAEIKLGEIKEAKEDIQKGLELSKSNLEAFNQAASVFMANGSTREAIEIFKQAKTKFKNEGIFSLQLASLYETSKDYKSALLEYFDFMGQDSMRFPLIEERFEAMISQGEDLELIEQGVKEIIKNSPQNKYAYKFYGELLLEAKKSQEAFNIYQTTDLLWKAQGEILLGFMQRCKVRKDYPVAIETGNYLLSQYQIDLLRVRTKLLLAQVFSEEKEFAKALEIYTEVMGTGKKDRFTAQAYFETGQIYFDKLNQLEKALPSYQTVISQFPLSEYYQDAVVRVGDVFLSQGKLKEAVDQYVKGFQDPRLGLKKEELRFKTAEIDFYQGKFKEALEGYSFLMSDYLKGFYVNNCLERISLLKEAKDDPNLLTFAQALLAKQKKDYVSAIALLDKIRKGQKSVLMERSYLESGEVYQKKGDFHQAISVFQEFLDKFPESYYSPQALKSIGDIYNFSLNDKVKARETYQEVLKRYAESIIAGEVREQLKKL